MPACAYCGSNEPLTREHLWPTALHRRVIEARQEKKSLFWLAKIGKEIGSEPTVRDVCALCNNVRLSPLDDYICEAFDRYFVHKYERHAKVEFEYNYHLLKRWLLKTCFNSARIHAAKDEMVFGPLLPYILGTSEAVGRSVQLYAQLAYPASIPEEFLEPSDPRPSIFYPDMNRTKPLPITGVIVGPCRHPNLSRIAAGDLLLSAGYDFNAAKVEITDVPYRTA